MSETNGHVTAEAFRDRANRLRTIASLDNWWREYDSKLPADVPPKTREKAERAYLKRKSELENTTKDGAKRVLNQDDHLGRTCLIGIWISAILSMYLNAQATYLGLEEFLSTEGTWQNVLRTSTCPGTGTTFASIASVAALVYGVVVPILILILFTVAGRFVHRSSPRKAAWPAFAGLGLLVLSLWHCTTSLTMFGLPWMMALLFAIGIDAGIVSLELSKIFSRDI
jgi:hypothetical protein